MGNSICNVVIIGGGGHSHSICDIIKQNNNLNIVGIVDNNTSIGFMGIPWLGGDEILPQLFNQNIAESAFVAIGDNVVRQKLTIMAKKIGYRMINAISPKAVVSCYSTLGEGVAIMAGVIINVGAKIGNGVILNTNCSIDHDTTVEDFCHIAPGCSVCGCVKIGQLSFLGVGSNVIDSVTIGSNTMIGAGAAVVQNIPNFCTAVGVPAKVIKMKGI